MFSGPLPDVPTLFVHASVELRSGRPISATGVGDTPQDAKLRHDGERAERIAMADLQEQGQLPWRMNEIAIAGVAAGRDDPQQVQNRALLELAERWACQSWWHGTLPGHHPDPQTRAAFDAAMANHPRRKPQKTGLLCLSDPRLPPVCVVWSCDRMGRSLCFGTACRENGPSAAVSALRELYQMEFGLAVIRHRRDNGIQISKAEQRIADRADAMSIEDIGEYLPCRESQNYQPRSSDSLDAGDLDIELSLQQYPERVDGHRIVIATAPELAVVSPTGNPCNPAQRWPLYGA